MKKYRKKPVVIEAQRWFRRGDHEKVIPYDYFGPDICNNCKNRLIEHGSIETLEGQHIVCPGDWIIKGVKGELYPCKPDIFEMTYEEIKDGKKERSG